MDDRGKGLEKISVSVAGGDETDDTGFVSFDPLKAGKYTVKVEDLSSDLAKLYDLPDPRSRTVELVEGEIAYLPFQLPRRAKLRVKVVNRKDRNVFIDDATITIK